MSKMKFSKSNISLTTSFYFKEYPILTHRGPLITEYLYKMDSVISKAVSNHPRTLAIRVDLRLPHDYGDVSSSLMSRFTESLKAQIRADLLRKSLHGTRVHQCNLRYIWVRERESSSSPHFHVLLLLNQDTYYTLGDFSAEHGRNMVSRIRKAWASALSVITVAVKGLVFFPKNAVYRLSLYSNDFCAVRADLFRRISYFAKLDTKEYGINSRSFGCSLK
ncbi:inovirus Gp2 family protein [Rheinheimera pacifica]|uniref:inovirus Gp2 family protein n=1 Tax=Rheinheimera pacifica TaxID=173990 RepID=UPI0039C91AB5